MAVARDLKTVQERNIKAIALRPSTGQGIATTSVTMRDGRATVADARDGRYALVIDTDRNQGGDDLGPDPGVLVRAGLGGCLAIGYVLWAARLDIALDRVEVVVEADYDARGMYGVDGVSPGWSGVRYTVNILSAAPEERIRELIETADRHSPILDDLRRPLEISRQVRITSTAKE